MKLTFLGAARQVTGSCYLLDTEAGKVLVDCGMFQGEDHLRSQRRLDWSLDPRRIRLVLLTHAHLDHCGLLPRLVALGFKGQVICTPATRDLAEVVLRDSAGIQEEDAAFDLRKWKKYGRIGPPPEPLYTVHDVEKTMPRFRVVEYEQWTRLLRSPLRVRFVDAGHIAGAASIEVQGDGPEPVTVAFSGDIGYPDRPILEDPEAPGQPSFLVLEGTYGDRLHEPREQSLRRFEQAIALTRRRRGALIIPTFAIGRAQELLYYLNGLHDQGRLGMPVFVDSPMAAEATAVVRGHPEVFDSEIRDLLLAGEEPFSFEGLRYLRTGADSATLNQMEGPFIVLAGSGMCTGGRIRHHLRHHLERPEDTILFVGFQARGTLGRQIQDGADHVHLMGKRLRVRAKVMTVEGFSAHADRDQLVEWVRPMRDRLRRVFLTHGEPEPLAALAAEIRSKLKLPVLIPEMGDTVNLESEPEMSALEQLRDEDLLVGAAEAGFGTA